MNKNFVRLLFYLFVFSHSGLFSTPRGIIEGSGENSLVGIVDEAISVRGIEVFGPAHNVYKVPLKKLSIALGQEASEIEGIINASIDKKDYYKKPTKEEIRNAVLNGDKMDGELEHAYQTRIAGEVKNKAVRIANNFVSKAGAAKKDLFVRYQSYVRTQVNDRSICLATPAIDGLWYVTDDFWNNLNKAHSDFRMLSPGVGGKMETSDLDNKKVPMLCFGGDHGSYGRFFHQSIDEYFEHVIAPLVNVNFKAKAITLDACLTMTILPAFIPLLDKGGIIIAYFTIAPGQFFSERFMKLEQPVDKILKDAFIQYGGKFDDPDTYPREWENVYTEFSESINMPESPLAKKGVSRCSDFDMQKIELKMQDIQGFPCVLVIYRDGCLYYDKMLDDYGSYFSSEAASFKPLNDDINKCKRFFDFVKDSTDIKNAWGKSLKDNGVKQEDLTIVPVEDFKSFAFKAIDELFPPKQKKAK